jgi:hypothetical protein
MGISAAGHGPPDLDVRRLYDLGVEKIGTFVRLFFWGDENRQVNDLKQG